VRQLGYSDELRRRTALTLAPGEMFRSAASSIAFFVDGQGFADPRRVVPSYASRVLMRRGQSFQPAWLYNTWEPFQRRIDEATSAELIGVAGHMGMDIFTIDDGWQAEYGDNRENLKNFPGDLARIRALLEEQRMGLGLWVPLAAISTQALIPGLLAAEGSELVGIASRSEERAAAAAARWGCRGYGSYDELLDDAEIDAVYVPLPNHLHAMWTVRALEAGKHVLCEKPLAISVREVDAIAEASRRTGCLVLEAFMYRHARRWQRAVQLVATGALDEATVRRCTRLRR